SCRGKGEGAAVYLARYRSGTSALVQAAFRVEAELARLPDLDAAWREHFLRVAEELAGRVDFSFRVALRGARLGRVLVCTAAAAEREFLEHLGRSLEGLNGLVADSVQACANRKTHDEMLGWFPPARAWNSPQPFPCRDFLLGQKFRLFAALDRLLAEAARRRWRVAWQANLRRYRPSPEDERAVRKNFVRVEDGGLPARVRDYQRAVAEGLGGARYLIDEFVGADEGEPRQGVAGLLEDCFRRSVRPYGLASAPLVWGGGEQCEELL